jgi:hypothetical protein
MSSTLPQLSLSPVYRHAQRALGAWLEQDRACARRQALRVRTALAALDAVERHRLVRWLAWLCLAAQHRGADLGERIRRLDAALSRTVEAALATLPPSMHPLVPAAASRVRRA